MRRLSIAGKTIHDNGGCYVIAEIGHNHQGSVETAREMFRVAKECGADAVKLQKRDRFRNIPIGLSSHDNGIAMAVAAFMLGARVVEKHFTFNHTWKGTDHAFSLEPGGFRKMVRDLRRLQDAMGDGVKRVYESERGPITKMGKKLVLARDLPQGYTLRSEDIAIKSPGDGVPPYDIDKIIGRVTRQPLVKDQDIDFEVLNGAEYWPDHEPLVQCGG